MNRVPLAIEKGKKRRGWRKTVGIGICGTALVALLFPVFSIMPSSAASPNSYLDDFSSASGMIATESGNSSSGCGFSWSAQSVLDADLPSPSLNGFLESVAPTTGASEAGSGHLTIQHWFAGGDQLAWRIPIALDQAVGDAQIKLVFDDPDWTVNPTSLQQFSGWTSQPGYESAFQRFTGVTGYAPHDDSQVLPATWGIDGAGHPTLTLSLGMIEANTSTVIGFTGTAVSTPGQTGVQNIAAGVAFGAKLVVDGTRPLAECHEAIYGMSEVQAGETANVEPVATDANGAPGEVPPGSLFSLASTDHDGLQLDATTGSISWSVPEGHEGGAVDVPVIVTYPDHDDFAAGSQRTVSALFEVTARTHATPPTAVSPELTAQTPQEVATLEATRNSTGAPPREREFEPADPFRQSQAARPMGPVEAPSARSSEPIVTLQVSGSPMLPILYAILGGVLLCGAATLLMYRIANRKSVLARHPSGNPKPR